MKKVLLVAILALGFAVQGYAQTYHRPHPRPYYHYRVMPSYYYWYPTYGYYYYPALSCYWWGSSWDAPSKIKIDCLELKRTASGRLRIKNGDQPKFYLSMWKENSLRFRCPSGIVVDISTGDGETEVQVYGKDGKTTAKYTL